MGAATNERMWHAWNEPIPIRPFVGAAASRTAVEPPTAERYLRPEPPVQTPELRYLQPSQLAADPNRKPEVTLVADRGARIELRAGAETPMAEIGTTLHNILALCSPGSENVTGVPDRYLAGMAWRRSFPIRSRSGPWLNGCSDG